MAAPSLKNHSLAIIKSSTQHIKINYLESKHLPVGHFISSPPFSIGGYDWALHLYPHGNLNKENKETHVSLFLKLLSETKEVQVEFILHVLHNRGKYLPVHKTIVHSFTTHSRIYNRLGCSKLIAKDKLEADFCKDGMLIISINIKVLSASIGIYDLPGGLCDDLKKLWRSGERFDVAFEVEGERIFAHRLILAARSPVLDAELYGPMTEAKASCIKIKDMKAEVFKALLCFIYTDNFEDHELKCGLSVELVQDLFAAADRYALENLKMQCQQRLFEALSIDMVLTTLILAEQHGSLWLKEKCLDFASKSEDFTQLAVTEEYVQIMHSFPSLLTELCEKVKDLSNSVNNVAKNQKAG